MYGKKAYSPILSHAVVKRSLRIQRLTKLPSFAKYCPCNPGKLSNSDLCFNQVLPSQVVAVHDVASTYHVPVLLESQGMLRILEDILRLKELNASPSLREKGRQTWRAWKALTASQDRVHESVSIALVGKYTKIHDSYLSVIKALEHAAMACSRILNLIWVDAEHLEPAIESKSPNKYHKAWHELCSAQGILVPGGFGDRGTDGMIAAVSLSH